MLTLTQLAALFTEAIATDNRQAFVSDWALSSLWGDPPDREDIPQSRIDFLDRLWIVSDWGISEICFHARISIRELEAITLTPYRTLMRWNSEPEKFSPRDRLLTLSHLGLLPRLE